MNFEELLKKAAQDSGLPFEPRNGACGVDADGVAVILQDAGDLLLMHTDLGALPEAQREHFAAAALEANFMYQGTGGSTLALNPADGHLILQRYNYLERLDCGSFLDGLSRFVRTAKYWMQLLEDSARADRGEDAHDSQSLLSTGLML
ncbi:MAG: type III secretion system chaperone [Succinivibrio sp.]|nr:type III secretion system chaperone [Succinivibrio sp.]